MMVFLPIGFLPIEFSPIGFLPIFTADPAPRMLQPKARSRTLECQRVTAGEGKQRHPGEIKTSGPRGDYIDRSAMICTQRWMRPGLRPARDEAILATLDARSNELAVAAHALRPDLQDKTWLVDAFYPSAPMTTKIAFATKNALMGQGLSVSDRIPTLAAGDIQVLTRMHPDEAYPTACARYAATGTLREDDVLLAVVSRDRRATILHGGLCSRGQWMWIR